jgi:hypothetical protein
MLTDVLAATPSCRKKEILQIGRRERLREQPGKKVDR